MNNVTQEETELETEQTTPPVEDSTNPEQLPQIVNQEENSENENAVDSEEIIQLKPEEIKVIKETKETILKEVTNQETTNNITSENSYNYYGCDEILNLENLSILAKAYPGVNIISWKPVNGAKSYVLYKYEEGYPAGVYNFNYDDLLILYDTAISDDVEYTYVVEAESKSSPSRAVFVQNTIIETSVKAIVPPEYVKARDLCGYEDGYKGEKKELGLDEWIIGPENIKTSWKDNTLTFSFPTKAYLSYSVYAFKGNEFNFVNNPCQKGLFLGKYRSFVNNKIVSGNAQLKSCGKYTIAVVVSSLNSQYKDSLPVESDYVVNVPATALKKGTRDINGSYIDEGKTIRLKWRPATLEDNSVVPASAYTVYSFNRAENQYVKIVNAKADEDYYYATFEPENSKIQNEYYIVLNINGTFEDVNNVVTVEPYIVLEEGTPVTVNDFKYSIVEKTSGISAKATFLIKLEEEQTIESLRYASVENFITEENVLNMDLTEFLDFKTDDISDTADYMNYKVEIDNLELNKKLAVLVEVKEPGKKLAQTYFISEPLEYKLSIYKIGNGISRGYEAWIQVFEKFATDDCQKNYRYAVFMAKVEDQVENDFYLKNDTEWIELFSGEPEFTNYLYGEKYFEVKSGRQEYGNYVFKIIKSCVCNPELEPCIEFYNWKCGY